MHKVKKCPSKIKNIMLCVLGLLVFSLAFMGSFSPSYTAFADSIEDNTTYNTRYHPLGNATCTFHTFNNDELKITQHDYPKSIGGLMIDNTHSSTDTNVRAKHEVIHQGTSYKLSLNQHLYYQDGGEYIKFYGYMNNWFNSTQIDTIRNNGALALEINSNLVLKNDMRSLYRYQFEMPKNLYKIRATAELLYKNNLKTLTFSTGLITDDYYNYSDYYPFIASNNTSFARINIGQLLSELTGERFDERRNDFICLNNLKLEFIAFDLPTTATTTTIYTKLYYDDLRLYDAAISEYNRLMYQYVDNPTLSLFSPINAFLNMEIYNGFTFGYFLLIVIGFSLFILLVKVLNNA